MSLNLHPFFMAEKNALATDGQWVWLYEVEVPTTPPTRYRFAKNNQEVRFRGNLYYPFPVTHTVLKQTESGSLPSLTMTVSNVSREVMATLEAHGGLIGQPVRLILTNLRAITSNQSVIEHDFKIISVTATDLAGGCVDVRELLPSAANDAPRLPPSISKRGVWLLGRGDRHNQLPVDLRQNLGRPQRVQGAWNV